MRRHVSNLQTVGIDEETSELSGTVFHDVDWYLREMYQYQRGPSGKSLRTVACIIPTPKPEKSSVVTSQQLLGGMTWRERSSESCSHLLAMSHWYQLTVADSIATDCNNNQL